MRINATLEQVQPIFGREIAGNHTVVRTLADGEVLCIGYLENEDTGNTDSFYFGAADKFLSDWWLCSIAEAKEIIRESSK